MTREVVTFWMSDVRGEEVTAAEGAIVVEVADCRCERSVVAVLGMRFVV